MRLAVTFVFGLLLAGCSATQAPTAQPLAVIAPFGPANGTVEGPNVPPGPFLSVGNVNCDPKAGAQFTRAIIWQTLSTTQGQGPIVVARCMYSATDWYPALPTGYRWLMSISTCPANYSAVTTRHQISPFSGGGDSGCDDPPGTSMLMRALRGAKPKPVTQNYLCDEKMKCQEMKGE